jgi:hypothetical protein
VPVGISDFVIDKIKIDDPVDGSKWVVWADALLQIETSVKQAGLSLRLASHHENYFSSGVGSEDNLSPMLLTYNRK